MVVVLGTAIVLSSIFVEGTMGSSFDVVVASLIITVVLATVGGVGIVFSSVAIASSFIVSVEAVWSSLVWVLFGVSPGVFGECTRVD